jgi:DNA primase large subunit
MNAYRNAYERREALRKAKARAGYAVRKERERIARERQREAQEIARQDAAQHARDIDPGTD